jgi:hypothetical protein
MPNNIARMAQGPSLTSPLPALGLERSVQSLSVMQSHTRTFIEVTVDRPSLSATRTGTAYDPNGGSF